MRKTTGDTTLGIQMKEETNSINPEVLISCLDVLCRAGATLFESDPKLAADITQAIEALSLSLEEEPSEAEESSHHSYTAASDTERNTWQRHDEFIDVLSVQPIKKGNTSSSLLDEEHNEIVDVLSNEVIFKNNRSVNK